MPALPSARRTGRVLPLLAAALTAAAASAPAGAAVPARSPAAALRRVPGALLLTVPRSAGAPGYTVRVATGELGLTTARAGRTVLATASGGTGALRFRAAGRWQHATRVTRWTWRRGVLTATAATTLAGATATVRLAPSADRYRLDWRVEGAGADRLGLAYRLASAGHWYGHGEARTPSGGPATDQPWPLETGQVDDPDFGPDSYRMVDPFWFTSSAAGLRVDTGSTMHVSLNAHRDGLGRFTVDSPAPYRATVFVESTARDVYRDYIGLVGRPERTGADYEQYRRPLWNTWAQFYTRVTQRRLVAYATELHAAGLDGHALQLDDRWESHYGDLDFDRTAFPHPRAMSRAIHRLGFHLGVWVTLWVNQDSRNYRYAARHGYLLRDAAHPGRPCTVHWWNGTAGIVDLADPRARTWYQGNLRRLMRRYGIDGLKFDTRFFDGSCRPDPGYSAAGYQRLGAALAARYDLQGAGIRVHWTPAAHRAGFVTRETDKGTGWPSLRASVAQDLALASIGYPFTETDMVGGSLGRPAPGRDVLVRWAEAASLMPLMYCSTSPVETTDTTTGRTVVYGPRAVALYRAAIERHERLARYIWAQVRAAVRTGDPVMRPLFFDFPSYRAGYPVADEWMLGPAVLAAPQLGPGATRTVRLPPGLWYDTVHGTELAGPATLHRYGVPLGAVPAFVRVGAPGAASALRALRPGAALPGGRR